MRINRLLSTYGILSFYVSNSFGLGSGGIGAEALSAKSLALGGAIVGIDDDPSFVYSNPAAIGDMGRGNFSLGLMYYNFSAKREKSGVTDKMDTTKAFVPNFSFAHSLMDGKFGVGFSVVSPYGLETEWPGTSNVRYVATKSTLNMLDVAPAISYRPSEKLALGFGLDYFSTFKANLQKKVSVDVINFLVGAPTLGSPDANSELDGDGSQWGYHSSVMYSPTKSNEFAVSYHSEVKTKIEGNVMLTGLSGASASAGVFGGTDFKTAASVDLFYPQNVQIGYSHLFNERHKVILTTAWYDWSSNQELKPVLPNATATQAGLLSGATPLKWRDVWSFAIGSDHKISEKWSIQDSAYYEPNVYPPDTFSPALPDLARIGLAIGGTYKVKNTNINLIYNPIFMKDRIINNNLGQSSAGFAGADISGNYSGIIHIVGLNVMHQFN